MLGLKKVAVTGGLSCGKSSVCRIFKELGAYVISADKIVHHLLSFDKNLGEKVIDLLGPGVLINKKIDRSRIAERIFQDQDLLRAFEKLIHPIVYEEIEKEYQKQCHSFPLPSLFIAEIPLLYESGGQKKFDVTIVVISDEKLCEKRFMNATGYHLKEFKLRYENQIPLEEKVLQADYIIKNNSSLADLWKETSDLYHELIKN